MIDVSILNEYITDISNDKLQRTVFEIGRTSFDTWFDNQINVFCNCTKLLNNETRCNQTNDIRYSIEITLTIQMIEHFAENKDYYYERLINQHKDNLEFEAKNGFEYNTDNKTKVKTKTTKRKPKQTSLITENKPKKETAAERKLKAHAIKINALQFKPKSINNADTL